MRKVITLSLMGVMLLMALSPFAFAATAPYATEYGPQTYLKDNYYTFGDLTLDNKLRNDITLVIDEPSISYQQVVAHVTLEYGFFNHHLTDQFVILANGVEVDRFSPSNVGLTGGNTYYDLNIDISNKFIGSDVYFQVVGLNTHADGTRWVDSWSYQTTTYSFKPLPVIDRTAITWLEAIWNKLDKLNNLADLLQLILDKLTQTYDWLKDILQRIFDKLGNMQTAIENIYTIQPETQAAFDTAMDGLKAALPMQQVEDQMKQADDMMNDSVAAIDSAPNGLVFGNVTYMHVITVPLLDFTQFASSVEKFRLLLKTILWCEFFIFVIRIMVPKLTA